MEILTKVTWSPFLIIKVKNIYGKKTEQPPRFWGRGTPRGDIRMDCGLDFQAPAPHSGLIIKWWIKDTPARH
jgi:hypothetical protein